MKKTTAFVITALGSIAVYETLKRYGVLDKARGKFEQEIGKSTGDRKLQAEGVYHSVKGEVKGTVQDIKDSIHDHSE